MHAWVTGLRLTFLTSKWIENFDISFLVEDLYQFLTMAGIICSVSQALGSIAHGLCNLEFITM